MVSVMVTVTESCIEKLPGSLTEDVAVQTALTIRVTLLLSFGFEMVNKAELAVSVMNSQAARFILTLLNP
jgi:hypothetical protein